LAKRHPHDKSEPPIRLNDNGRIREQKVICVHVSETEKRQKRQPPTPERERESTLNFEIKTYHEEYFPWHHPLSMHLHTTKKRPFQLFCPHWHVHNTQSPQSVHPRFQVTCDTHDEDGDDWLLAVDHSGFVIQSYLSLPTHFFFLQCS